MHKYFQHHSKLHSFHVFSLEHLLTIGVILVLCILLFVFKNKLIEKEGMVRHYLAILLLTATAWEQLWLLHEKAWSIKTALPLQLSDLAVILGIIMLWTKSKKLFQFMYFAGTGSSIQAILTPDLGKFSFPHIRYIEFFILHGGVVMACLLFVTALHYLPTVRSLWVTALIVNLYAVFIYFFNKWFGANYLYIMKKPPNATLLDFLGPWPWYLISLELVMILSFYLLYSPFWLKSKLTAKVD